MTMHMPDPRALAAALGGEVAGNSILAPGPGHSPNDRSLSIKITPDAPDGFVVHSFAGDDPLVCKDHVRAKARLGTWQPKGTNGHDSIAAMQARHKLRYVAEYIYRQADGTPYLRVARTDPKGPFPQSHWTGSGWASGKPQGPKIPYRLPEMLAAVHDVVLVVEGEKDADACMECGFVATTSSEGAGKWTADLNPYFAGKTVYILPDNDDVGRDHAREVAENLRPVAAEVRIVNLPGLPAKGDVSDWLAAGGDTSKLIDMCRATPPYTGEDDPGAKADEEVRPPAFTDEALALRFADRHAADLRYVAAWGRWLQYDGQRWDFDDTLLAFDLSRKVCREAAGECNKASTASGIASAKTVAAIERLAKADRRLAATIDQWDADLWLLNTPDGVVDLRTGELRQHRREDYLTKVAAVSPGGACPVWREHLLRVMNGDAEMVAYLQRVLGYALTGSTREHALFFAYGTGANGKTVTVNAVASLLADYHRTASVETFTASNTDRHPTELAGLRGARLVTASETEQGRRWAESRIKSLTGGEKVEARFMRQDFFEFTPQLKLFIAGNHKPGLTSVDEAIRRRFHLIPFTVTIPPAERDHRLPERLKAEGPGILAWMVEGCLAWQREGLRPPAAVQAATAAYLESEDLFGQWLQDECDAEPANSAKWEAVGALFVSWSKYAERAGEKAGSKKAFSEAMQGRGFLPFQHGHAKTRAFRGVRMKVTQDQRVKDE